MLSRIGFTDPEGLEAAWDREYDSHIKEVASLLYDRYIDSKKSMTSDATQD